MPKHKSNDAAVQLLLDRAEIYDLQTHYAQWVDQRNWEQLGTVFAKEGLRARYREEFNQPEGVVKMISGVARFHTTYHFMGSRIIEVLGDEATSKTNSQLTHHFNIDGLEYQFNAVGGRFSYIDKLRRTGPEGAWQVYDRGDKPDWTYTGVTKAKTSDPAVQYLLDRAEIKDVFTQLGLGIDLRDWERVARCFAPESLVREQGRGLTMNGEQYAATLKALERFEFTKHLFGTHLVEVSGDRAELDSYAMVTYAHKDILTSTQHQWTDPSPRYADTFVRRNGRWVIGSHRLEWGRTGRGAPPPTSKDPAVQYLLDRAEIEDVISRFAIGVDRRDWDLVRAALAPKFEVRAADRVITDAEEMVAFIKGRVEQFPWTTHLTGCQLIEINGDQATSDTYCYLTHKDSPEAPASDWAKGGRRMVDTLQRIDGRWRIVERRLVSNKTDVKPHSIRYFPAYGLGKTLPPGSRDNAVGARAETR